MCARGFWQHMQRAFVDVRTLLQATLINCLESPSNLLQIDREKERKDAQRESTEQRPGYIFNQLINRFYMRLSELFSDKQSQYFSETAAWVKRKVMFNNCNYITPGDTNDISGNTLMQSAAHELQPRSQGSFTPIMIV